MKMKVINVVIKISLLCVPNSLHKLYTIQPSQHLCEEATIIDIVPHFTVE